MQTGPTVPHGMRRKITGPGASALKYDLLTALLVTAARGAPDVARLALRLSLLITARFNWQRESFAVGQKEIARMWGVTERTAKRDMAAMKARGWIAVSVPAARGRVAQHRIALDAVLRETMPHWDAVGPDFVARMTGLPEQPEVPAGNVVPFQRGQVPAAAEGTPWQAAAERLRQQDPAVFNAWLAGLVPAGEAQGLLVLMAPSRFVADYVRTHYLTRVIAATVMTDPTIRDVEVTWPDR